MGFHLQQSQANDSPFLRDRRLKQQDRRSNPLINPIQPTDQPHSTRMEARGREKEEEIRTNNEKPNQT